MYIFCVVISLEFFFAHNPIECDETLIGITTPGQSGPKSNGNERVLHTPQIPELESHRQM